MHIRVKVQSNISPVANHATANSFCYVQLRVYNINNGDIEKRGI